MDTKKKMHKISDLAGAFGESSDEWVKIEEELYKDRLQPARVVQNIKVFGE